MPSAGRNTPDKFSETTMVYALNVISALMKSFISTTGKDWLQVRDCFGQLRLMFALMQWNYVSYYQNPSIELRNKLVDTRTGLVWKMAHHFKHQCAELRRFRTNRLLWFDLRLSDSPIKDMLLVPLQFLIFEVTPAFFA